MYFGGLKFYNQDRAWIRFINEHWQGLKFGENKSQEIYRKYLSIEKKKPFDLTDTSLKEDLPYNKFLLFINNFITNNPQSLGDFNNVFKQYQLGNEFNINESVKLLKSGIKILANRYKTQVICISYTTIVNPEKSDFNDYYLYKKICSETFLEENLFGHIQFIESLTRLIKQNYILLWDFEISEVTKKGLSLIATLIIPKVENRYKPISDKDDKIITTDYILFDRKNTNIRARNNITEQWSPCVTIKQFGNDYFILELILGNPNQLFKDIDIQTWILKRRKEEGAERNKKPDYTPNDISKFKNHIKNKLLIDCHMEEEMFNRIFPSNVTGLIYIKNIK